MPKSKWVEWDAFPDPPKGRRKPRATIEVLDPEPEPTPRVHRVTVDHVYHRRSSEGICPQRIVIVVAFAVLALVLLRSPGAFILLAALNSFVVLACPCRYCCGACYRRCQ